MIQKSKILNILLILTSLIGYIEWGGTNKMFLFQAEIDIFNKLFIEPKAVIHPLIILPVFGQLFLLVTLFQKKPRKMLTGIGMGFLGILLIIMFVVGIASLNFKIILSTLPFMIVAGFAIKHYRKIRPIYKEE